MRTVLLLGAAAVCTAQTCDAGLDQNDVSHLVRVYKNALAGDLLGAATIEAIYMSTLAEEGKSKTIWMNKEDWATPAEGEPALNHVVRRLYQAEVAAAAEEGRNLGNVAGAELWVHHKKLNWRMGGPHFDKDEVSYSEQFKTKTRSTMAFPLRGTVTYLSSCGGPTVVYNQTMNEDLTALSPTVPREAAVVWPEIGKHITFAGNAYHQVRGDANLDLRNENCSTRTTLLVNWWDHKVPGDEFTAEWREKHNMPAAPKLEEQSEPMTREPIGVVENPEDHTTHSVAMFPTTAGRKGERAFHFTLPKGGCCGKGCVVRWTGGTAFANVPVLDSTNVFVFQEAMTVTPEKPSIILFHHADEFRAAAQFAAKVEEELSLRAYIVDVGHSPGVLGLFGLKRTDVPTAGLFDGKTHALKEGTKVTLDSIKELVAKREGGKKLGDPYKNTIDIDVVTTNVMTADTLARCAERGMERLMLTSRGMRTHCAFLLPGKEKANLAKFRKGLAKWEQKSSTKAWETFYVRPQDEHLLTDFIANVPQERPLFAAIDPEFNDVISWPEEGQSETATSVQFAEWLGLVDRSRLSKSGL